MTKPIPKPFKLCYVRHNILYFTDSFEKQWGDDWDDAPYEHNAGEPYEWGGMIGRQSKTGNMAMHTSAISLM